MPDDLRREDGNSELWRTIFQDGHPDLSAQHRLHTKLPREPRCRLCKVPFSGWGGLYMRFRGKRMSSRNPHYCNACDGFLDTFPGGAELELAILFIDIRNSTAFAQANAPEQVSQRINRFLDDATGIITDNDGFIMAFYGDCVVAVWPPGFSGDDYARKALETGQKLARHMSQTAAIPAGVGVHCGPVYICTVQAAKGLFRDVSVFGSDVNIAARLAGEAEAGEVLASAELLRQSGGAPESDDIRHLDLKGIDRPVDAVSVR